VEYRKTLAAGALLAGAAGAAILSSPALGEAESGMAERCEMLAGQEMGDVQITAAAFHAAGREIAGALGAPAMSLPPHCLVEGMINERVGAEGVTYGIGFELALPEDWNGRYLLQGGGGLNGVIRPAIGPVASGDRNALSRGFAVASHDSGHKGVAWDESFMADQRAALDFAEASVRTVTLATREITAGFYGTQPHHSYMTGCSTGGREGMLASQRYPELFDGIVIGAPAMRAGYSNLGIEYAQVMLNRTLPQDTMIAAGLSEAERNMVLGEVLKQCDALDGASDGVIANVEACRSFDPSTMSCEAGEQGSCLAPAKVEALQLAFAGPRDASGRPIYSPIPWDTGVTYQGPGLPGFVPSGAPGPFGPASTAREIDIDERVHQLEWDAVGRLTDTPYWTNLSTYLGKGSKLIFFHGVSDPWFSAFATWDYFERAREANGAAKWDDAARFYMVPGMMHCSGGNAFTQFDLLGPLVDWVEQGEAPESVPATRLPGDGASMPLCPHPQYAHYDGGPEGEASSFSCRMPEG